MLLGAYRLVSDLAAPLLALHLRRRVRRGKEDPARLGERWGRAAIARPEGPLLWLHAASVGESLAALPLIERLLAERLLNGRGTLQVLVTTGTFTSAGLMAERLPDRALHQFAPLDRASAWRAFFAHWRPDTGCLIESEIWPNLVLEAERAAVPLALVNGRMSPRSARRWGWAPASARRLLGSFTLCLARTEADADRLAALGARDVRSPGDLKHAAAPLPVDQAARKKLEAMIGDRPVWLAASTHPGEEAAVLEAHRLLRERRPDLLTVIAPRHPERGGDLAGEFADAGETVARRSQGEPLAASTGIYLADTLGELGLFYRLANVAFIGGSLMPNGGHNPLEAARLGCAPLFGPHTGNFQEMTAKLLEAGAACRVEDAADLASTVTGLLDDPAALQRMVARAEDAGAAEGAVLQRICEALAPLLEERLGPQPAALPHHACA